MKVVPHKSARKERRLQWFKIYSQLPDNPTQIPIVNQTRRNRVIREEQHQINIQKKPYIIPL